jgi:hypothetical protein
VSVLDSTRNALILASACVALCGAANAAPSRPRAKGFESVAEAASPALWLLHPTSETSLTQAPNWAANEALLNGIRLRRHPNGSSERSADVITGSATTALRVPDAWGGGFVFHSDIDAETALWYAPSWLAPLQPLGRFGERADRVTLGFGKIYVHLGDSGETVAVDARDGHHSALGTIPKAPGYFDLRFWSDWFAVASTDVRGVQVTFDAGATWHTTGITSENATFTVEDDGIGIRTGADYLVLRPSGAWQSDDEDTLSRGRPEPIGPMLGADTNRLFVPAMPLGSDAIRNATLHGWATSHRSALLAANGSVGVIDLVTGETSRLKRAQYSGYESCHAVPLGRGVAMICPLEHAAVGVFRVQSDLSLELLTRFDNVVSFASNATVLLAHAPCQGLSKANERRTRVCLIDDTGARDFLLPTGFDEARIVPLSSRALAFVVPPTASAVGSLRILTDADASSRISQTIPLRFKVKTDAKTRSLVESGFWLMDGGTLSEGRLGFWIASSNKLVGVSISKDGVMTVGRIKGADLRRTHVSGPRAIELTSGEVAYQSTDYGQTWAEFELPRGLTAASTLNAPNEVGCSQVGCALGSWLRIGYNIPREKPDAVPDSAAKVQLVAQLSQVPRDAPTPEPVHYRPSAYSQWRLRCYPNGSFEDATSGSAASVYGAGQTPTRFGHHVGFGVPIASSNVKEMDLAASARRAFLGVKHPERPNDLLAFDIGEDGEHQFRSYVFGPSDRSWAPNSEWLVRVADRFAVSGLWSTTPTRAPWPDVRSAAQLFGANRSNHHSASWQLVLDPSERAGLLRATLTGSTELHFIEENSAITSIGSQSFGSLSGAVKVSGLWYFGAQEGNRFSIYQVRQGSVTLQQSYPVSDFVQTTLIRNDQANSLALLLRAPAGTWHIYPLAESFEAGEPIVVERDTLNEVWPKCEERSEGWVIINPLPLSRFSPGASSDLLTFESDTEELVAEAVVARTLVNPTHHCVEAISARVKSAYAPRAEHKRLPPTANTIPLTLTDRTNDVRHGFQCGP